MDIALFNSLKLLPLSGYISDKSGTDFMREKPVVMYDKQSDK